MRPFQSIRSLLVHPKDKHRPQDICECVYKTPCKNCNKNYIGETENELDTYFWVTTLTFGATWRHRSHKTRGGWFPIDGNWHQLSISHRCWDIMRHLLNKHIPIVNALDAYFVEFGDCGLCNFSVHTPSSCRGPSCETLTATVDQQASIVFSVWTVPFKYIWSGENWWKLRVK